ncbi:hypothetical protein M5K25_021994 [Dendrobium thyrsiflorum]|uniref:Leucine-rich repeat-containing N-terminal plant-type domain-containing protein n=1 Tax=Dendrobium thyrsiflorum TaxID=117978 RepID=A0ABD0U5E4_DENTH
MEPFHFKFDVLLVLLILELFLINCDAAGQCLEAENSALLQLKKGFTTGKPETWLPGTNCCSWEGVTCAESGRITGLNLSSRFISGTIDPGLFNLTSLDTLNFANNRFDGIPIPDSGWDRLVNLSSLDLSFAGFVGKVPASISRLTKLNFLDLSGNSLAINPMIFQNMSSLKELILDHTNVSSYRMNGVVFWLIPPQLSDIRHPQTKRKKNIALGHLVCYILEKKYNLIYPEPPTEEPIFFTNASFRSLFHDPTVEGEESEGDKEAPSEPAPVPNQNAFNDIIQRFDTMETNFGQRFDQIDLHMKTQEDRHNLDMAWIRGQTDYINQNVAMINSYFTAFNPQPPPDQDPEA